MSILSLTIPNNFRVSCLSFSSLHLLHTTPISPSSLFLRFRVSSLPTTTEAASMANDALLRTCLVCLGAIIVLIGLYTYSFKKMFVTYVYGVVGIAGVLLPDWEFFDRDFSQWVNPISANENDPSARKPRSKRFRIYPLRVVLYTMIYSFGLYKWWNYVFNS